MKPENPSPSHLSKIKWKKEDPNMFSVFNKKKLMTFTSICYLVYFQLKIDRLCVCFRRSNNILLLYHESLPILI